MRGWEYIATYGKCEASQRGFCFRCGGHLFARHPARGVVDVYPAVLGGFVFEPQLHIYYREKVLRLRDGLPKFADLPAEMGGSGEIVSEDS